MEPVEEDKLPPRLRKGWIRKSSEQLKGMLARENAARALSPFHMNERSRTATPTPTQQGRRPSGVGLGLKLGFDGERMDVDHGEFSFLAKVNQYPKCFFSFPIPHIRVDVTQIRQACPRLRFLQHPRFHIRSRKSRHRLIHSSRSQVQRRSLG